MQIPENSRKIWTVIAVYKTLNPERDYNVTIYEYDSFEKASEESKQLLEISEYQFYSGFPVITEKEVGVCISKKLPDGKLTANTASDESYPGFDIEYSADSETDGKSTTRPRVLTEYIAASDTLRTAIWNDPENEDYTKSVILNKNYDD